MPPRRRLARKQTLVLGTSAEAPCRRPVESAFSVEQTTGHVSNPLFNVSGSPKTQHLPNNIQRDEIIISVTWPAQSYTRADAVPSFTASTSAKTVLSFFHSRVGAGLFAFMLRHKLQGHAGNHKPTTTTSSEQGLKTRAERIQEVFEGPKRRKAHILGTPGDFFERTSGEVQSHGELPDTSKQVYGKFRTKKEDLCNSHRGLHISRATRFGCRTISRLVFPAPSCPTNTILTPLR